MSISDWSSDVCSSDLEYSLFAAKAKNISDLDKVIEQIESFRELDDAQRKEIVRLLDAYQIGGTKRGSLLNTVRLGRSNAMRMRSEEHTSELQSLMRISYAVFCLKKKNSRAVGGRVIDVRTRCIYRRSTRK